RSAVGAGGLRGRGQGRAGGRLVAALPRDDPRPAGRRPRAPALERVPGRAGRAASCSYIGPVSPHPFDEATAVSAAGPHHWVGPLDSGWFGGAAPHGGHLAAQLLRAIECEAAEHEAGS